MTIPKTVEYLKYVNLQMASEAFLVNPDGSIKDDIVTALNAGNLHSLLFTETQATEFAAQWEVVDQRANTNTGFSGTLFRCKLTDPAKGLVAGQLVLSFRSTEFIDDNLRDSVGTNAFIFKNNLWDRAGGWAFGQIADMEAWYQELLTAGGPLAGQSFDVTGYSLGGHLATAFGILRGEAGDQGVIKHIYTYNGAGTGDVVAGKTLTAVIQNFSDVLAGVEPMHLNATQRADCWKKAQADLDSYMAESIRIHSLRPRSGGPLNESPEGVFNQLRYWYALEVASLDTTGAIRAFDPPTYADPRFMLNTLMTELAGSNVSGVAVLGVRHSTNRVTIQIENQPLTRGSPEKLLSAGLSDNWETNDFGDTHSLVLIVDSLAVMDTLVKVDGNLTQAALTDILKSATASKAVAKPGSQGEAEGDTLETVVNALGKIFLSQTEFDLRKLDPTGLNVSNTWWIAAQREKFHEVLNAINTAIGNGTQRTVVSLATLSAAELQAAASNPDAVATRYALQELNSFIIGDNSLYDKFNQNGELNLFSTETGKGLSPQWVEDRAALLAAANAARLDNNLNGGMLIANPTASDTAVYRDLTSNMTLRIGLGAIDPKRITFGSEFGDTLTGGNQADHLYGNAGTDILRGNAGDDYLEGGTGNDTLRGGLGNDTYRIDKNGGLDTILDAGGGDGSDGQGSIVYNGSELSGTLTQDKVTRNLYHHPDNPTLEFRYIGADGARGSLVIIDPVGARIILQDWASGELGLTLAGSSATSPSRSSIDGDLNLTEYTATVAAVGGVITYDPAWRNIQVLDTTFQYDADGNIAGIASRDVKYNQVDALGNLIGSPGGAARDDSLNGSGNGDQIRGYAGNDTLRGNGGDDSIEGGADDDRVLAGAGNDRILGGSGSDILQGEADDDTLYAEDAVASDQLYARGETQNATGLRGDWLDGGAGDDTLAGEGGNDMLEGSGTLLVWVFKSRCWRYGVETRSASNDLQWRVAA